VKEHQRKRGCDHQQNEEEGKWNILSQTLVFREVVKGMHGKSIFIVHFQLHDVCTFFFKHMMMTSSSFINGSRSIAPHEFLENMSEHVFH
jgi:hypothetical protein